MRRLPRQVPRRGRALILLSAATAWAGPSPERGAELAAVARCGACHVSPDGAPWVGGYAIETRFGTFYGPNLTQDPATGLGGWSLDTFSRALRHGRDPHGRPYWPAFPYPSYTGLDDADVADLWAFFQTIPAQAQPDRPHDTRWPWGWRGWLGVWRLGGFDPGPLETSDRGEYLATAVAHCGECHTPRGAFGGLRRRRALAGSDAPPEPAPNLTQLDWDPGDWASFLADGIPPDGDAVGGEMRRVIRDGTALLSDADRAAIGAWIESLPPRGRPPVDDEAE